jgi:dolichol-phosphate mannosyltransferase
MKNVFAMLPCYNEEKDIESLVHRWLKLNEDFKKIGYTLSVYCIDDKSIDTTKRVICKLVEEFPSKVHLIAHEENKGLGGALRTGLSYFVQHCGGNDLCVLMDGDNTHDPLYALDMILKIKEGYDCVIASRYCRTSKTIGVSGMRLFMSWGARIFYTFILGVKNVKDYTCGYRVYTYDILRKGFIEYGDALVERRSFACMMEILYKLYLLGGKFAEVPFELQYSNKRGESKMRIVKTVKESFWTALQLRFSNKSQEG